MNFLHRAFRNFAWTLAALLLLASCEGERAGEAGEADTLAQAADTAAAATLYDRLGGEAAIRSVVDSFVARAAADDTLNFTRQGTESAWEATPENVELLKTGVLNGDLKAGSLTVVAGSRMRGQADFGWDDKESRATRMKVESVSSG